MDEGQARKLAHVVGNEEIASKLIAAGLGTPAAIRAAGMDVWETILTTDEIGNMPGRLWPEGYVAMGPDVAGVAKESLADVSPMPILSDPPAVPEVVAKKPKKSK